MSNSREIDVHIGQIRIAKGGETLKTILGSCLGVALIWRSKGICSLAHCLLPEAPRPSFRICGRFVSQAIPSMMAMMRIREEDISEIEAVIAGGGQMTGGGCDTSVGSSNILVAERELKRLKIKIIYRDVGGFEGRRFSVSTADGAYKVDRIPRIFNAS